MATFLATHPKRLSAAKQSQLDALVRDTRYSVSYGNPVRNQPAITLCFDGPRDMADPAIIEAFRRICGNA